GECAAPRQPVHLPAGGPDHARGGDTMKVLGYAWLILLLVPLQVVLVDRISLFGIRPDLPLVAVCLIGLYHGEIDALLAGIAIGFAQDLFSGGVPWGNLCLKPMLGLIAGLASRTVLNLTGRSALGRLLPPPVLPAPHLS